MKKFILGFVTGAAIFFTIPILASNVLPPENNGWMKLEDYQKQFGTLPFVKSTDDGVVFNVRTAKCLYNFKYYNNAWYIKLITVVMHLQ